MRTSSARYGPAAVAAALALVLAGCVMSLSGQSPEVAPDPGDAPATSGDVTTVGLRFMPEELTVAPGTTVRWVNEEAIGHTITSGDWSDVNESTGLRGAQSADGTINQPLAARGTEGDSFEFTFDQPGRYPYFCSIHLAMNGVVIVEADAESLPSTTHQHH